MTRPRVLLLAATLAASPAPGDDGPPTIVRGTDPAQFDLVGIGPDAVAIVDGEVRLAGKPLGYLATRTEYENCIITFEWRYDRPEGPGPDAGSRGNGGLLLHVAGPRKVWPACVQVQLAQADPGAVFALGDASIRARSDPAAQREATRPAGEWNRSEVTCRGGEVVSRLNGIEVARGEGARPARGAIGWQSEGHPVRFRNIRIKTLP